MTKLYDEFPAYHEDYLKVSDLHEIYYEESGNPEGKPVIVLHGGPGSKSKPKYRRFFNPKKYRVIMFDQRGCGKSKPKGETKDNTAQDLVEDIEKIREHLGIDKWIVFGGSWGSTLALAYVEKYSKAVNSILLRGIWLVRKRDADWLLVGDELRRMFPDLYEKREEDMRELGLSAKNYSEKANEIFISGTILEQKKLAAMMENWQGQFSKVDWEVQYITHEDVSDEDVLDGKIFAHYTAHDFFLTPNQLLKNVSKIPDVPIIIIQGRYDMVCPFEQAWMLHKTLDGSILETVPGSGHNSGERKVAEKLVEWTDKLAG